MASSAIGDERLIILVGVTADAEKMACVKAYFEQHFEGVTILPKMPQRRGIQHCANWLVNFLRRERLLADMSKIHFLNYISGGHVFRLAAQEIGKSRIGRVVYVRGPIQEMVPRALIRRYTWPLIRLTQGKMVTDLAGRHLDSLPSYPMGQAAGLIIETGTSELASSLGLNPASVPEAAWNPEALLPGATDVLRIPESHDQVYGTEAVLGAILSFIRTACFCSRRDEG